MIILKLALITCGFYLAIALLLEGLLLVAARAAGGVGLTRGAFFFLFAIAWLISFSLAWHFVSKNFPFKV